LGPCQSRAQANVYSTSEPYEAFNKRIDFCIKIRNDAVKAMKFHETSENKDVLKEEAKDGKDKKGTNPSADDDPEVLDLDDEDADD
jgi:26S proteasome regulatory subunit N3